MKKVISFVMMLVLGSFAHAGGAKGKVVMLQAGHGYSSDNAYFLVPIEGERTSRPACAADDRMAINPATEAGKAMVSMLLAAKATGSDVELFGTGSYGFITNIELISYMRGY